MLSLRAAALLVGAWIVAAAATSFPASVDLNLVFPRNATYDANALLPIVFAFSNPALITPLQGFLSFQFYEASNDSNGWDYSLFVQPTNHFHLDTNGTTYLAVGTLSELFGKAGTWLLRWTFDTTNCSTTNAGYLESWTFRYLGVGYSDGSARRSVTFSTTTGGDGAQPDVAAAAANTTCGTQNATGSGPIIAEVAGTLNVSLAKPDFNDNFYGDTCAVVSAEVGSPSRTEPLSCAVSLDAGAIASVSAAVTRHACSSRTPVISCTPAASSSVASGLRPIAVSVLSFSPAIGSAAGMVLAMAAVHLWGGLF
ncbi:hypothetical protein SPI_03738 [Niveomyces insectorum RCEF 264]|uniref:DUF7136 domain-containing protein n=1 Tax=Niveomyces insectorum RCEF 264 TaxID=1081102 RepID=A0A167WBF1_9HYPO|nr:hypothetical protein SPI_03738 [Niveomyces insectorum RCEF 264]